MSELDQLTEAELEARCEDPPSGWTKGKVIDARSRLAQMRLDRWKVQMDLMQRSTEAAEAASEAAKKSARSAFWAAVGGVLAGFASLVGAGFAAGAG